MRIEMFKRREGIGYKETVLALMLLKQLYYQGAKE